MKRELSKTANLKLLSFREIILTTIHKGTPYRILSKTPTICLTNLAKKMKAAVLKSFCGGGINRS